MTPKRKSIFRALGLLVVAMILFATLGFMAFSHGPTAPTVVATSRALPTASEHIASHASSGLPPARVTHGKGLARSDFVPPSTTGPDTLIASSREAAADGDRVATRVLAEALHDCFFADRGGDDALKDHIARQVVAHERLSTRLNTPVVATEDPGTMLAARQATRDACLQVPAADAKTWLGLTENAAQAGDDRARTLYARSALAGFETQASQVENIDEYERRKSTAFGFLNDSLEEGNCGYEVINLLQAMSPDPTARYVYGNVMLQMAAASFDAKGVHSDAAIAAEQADWRRVAKIMQAPVPDNEIKAAENAADDIYKTYCAG